jgi:hypothetical protein
MKQRKFFGVVLRRLIVITDRLRGKMVVITGVSSGII